jgi:hypothetical protein
MRRRSVLVLLSIQCALVAMPQAARGDDAAYPKHRVAVSIPVVTGLYGALEPHDDDSYLGDGVVSGVDAAYLLRASRGFELGPELSYFHAMSSRDQSMAGSLMLRAFFHAARTEFGFFFHVGPSIWTSKVEGETVWSKIGVLGGFGLDTQEPIGDTTWVRAALRADIGGAKDQNSTGANRFIQLTAGVSLGLVF